MENKYISNIEIGEDLYVIQDSELADKVETKLEKVFVDTLPDVEEAKENVLYIIEKKNYVGEGQYETECVPYVFSSDKNVFLPLASENTGKYYSKTELNVSDEVNESTGAFKYVVPDSKAVINYVENKIAIDESELILKYENEKFGTVLSLYHNTTDKLIEVRGIDNAVVSSISTESIVGSGIVENAYLKEEEEGTFIVLKFQNVEETIDIDVTKLIDIYNGSNIELSEKYSVPSSYTAPLSGMNMDSAIGNLVKKAQLIESRISDIEGKTGSIPKGIICMWSGLLEDIPSGWHLCDGNDGTPDLRNRFIVGTGSKYGVGDTGGNDSVTLTEDQMPSHSHYGDTWENERIINNIKTTYAGDHTHDLSITNDEHSHYATVAKDRKGYPDGSKDVGNGTDQNQSFWRGQIVSGDERTTGYVHWHGGSKAIKNGEHQHIVEVIFEPHTHHYITIKKGGDKPFDNRPMYYALAFIMKIEEGSDSEESGTSSNDTCIKCADLDEKDYPVGTFAMHSGATGTYRRGFIYERTDNGWVSTLVQNVIQ